jgi:hypothetical protein
VLSKDTKYDLRGFAGVTFVAANLSLFAASFFVAFSAEALDRIRIAVSNPNMPNLTVAAAQK